MIDSLRKMVEGRAKGKCEYCQLPRELDLFPFQVDHIIPRKHHGETVPENLALCCFACNVAKGSDLAGLDPDLNLLTRLFHPRLDSWQDHFFWNGAELVGLTPIGRTTAGVLKINSAERLEFRRLLTLSGGLTSEG